MKNNILTLICALSIGFGLQAQIDYFPKNDGVIAVNSNYTALTNAKIYVNPTTVIEDGTLLFKGGVVISVGTKIAIPANTVVVDAKGKTIYPSFVDAYSTFGVKTPERPRGGGRTAVYEATREGYYWNDHIRAEQDAVNYFQFDSKTAENYRQAGFGAVNTHMADGIVRGTGTLVALTPEGSDAQRILASKSGQYLSTSKSVQSAQSYPGSIMGTLSLLEQMYIDADWYAKGNVPTTDLSLEALNRNKGLFQIMVSADRNNALRTDKVGDKFGVQFVFIGSGDEYERLKEVKATNGAFILPINFPKPYDVEDVFTAEALELSTLRKWNQSPANPKMMHDAGIPFAITMDGHKSAKDFFQHLRQAVNYGLDKETALAALTQVPASILGQSSKLGTLKVGAHANFIVTSGDIFEDETVIHENWVRGQRDVLSPMDNTDIRGNYTVSSSKGDFTIELSGSLDKLKSTVKQGDKELKSNLSMSGEWATLTFASQDSTVAGVNRLSAKVVDANTLSGQLSFIDGSVERFQSTKTVADTKVKKDKDSKPKEAPVVVPVTYPNVAFGFDQLPVQETTLFKNATVWTNEAEGVLTETDVLVKGGKIVKIGKNLSASGATIVDATEKHLTAGVIDEHSHIAASSINEGGHNSSAEVSIGDVVLDNDSNVYRNLAGGVTSIQILHGSANPIGGQSAIIKLKWGRSASELLNPNAKPFIKFALGENVKQSNWSSFSRFPQTRMGVEQVYVDYFTRAKAYDDAKKSGKPYRKDLEMEVLAQIINKERFISCHSYVQSEINMLMKVAEQFNFKVNTFTHILEGYKVADKMRDHGVGASTFSDWWAYKFEVNDAIPYNAAIMHNVGVVTAINSDDAEMSRRLNQEAAKAMKYGGVSAEEAWKMVTLNPAKLLQIDDRVGSVKVGKDADLVLWNGNPLSVYTSAEKTMIEGVVYFDKERDAAQRKAIAEERTTLINMMLKEKNKGMATQPVSKKEQELLHCDSL